VQGGGDDGCGVGSGGGPGDSKWDCGEEGVQGGGDYGCGVGPGGYFAPNPPEISRRIFAFFFVFLV